jgi:hypothetical protein
MADININLSDNSDTSRSDALVNAALASLFHVELDRPIPGDNIGYQPIHDGSGFLVTAPSGQKKLITARHVVMDQRKPGDEISVYTSGHFYKARISENQPPASLDVRILDFIGDAPPGNGLKISANSPRRNDPLISLGYKYMESYSSHSVYSGHLKYPVNCNVENEAGQVLTVFDLTPRTDRGTSGGPVLNSLGEAVGVISGGVRLFGNEVTTATPMLYILPYLDGVPDQDEPHTCRQ